MSILKTFFRKFKLATKTLTNNINLTKFAFFPMKIFVCKVTSSAKIMNFSTGEIDKSMSFKLQQFLFLFATKKLYMSMKRQPIFHKLMLQKVFNCHYMQATQIREKLFLQSTCRHLFYYGALHAPPLVSSLCVRIRSNREDIIQGTGNPW